MVFVNPLVVLRHTEIFRNNFGSHFIIEINIHVKIHPFPQGNLKHCICRFFSQPKKRQIQCFGKLKSSLG